MLFLSVALPSYSLCSVWLCEAALPSPAHLPQLILPLLRPLCHLPTLTLSRSKALPSSSLPHRSPHRTLQIYLSLLGQTPIPHLHKYLRKPLPLLPSLSSPQMALLCPGLNLRASNRLLTDQTMNLKHSVHLTADKPPPCSHLPYLPSAHQPHQPHLRTHKLLLLPAHCHPISPETSSLKPVPPALSNAWRTVWPALSPPVRAASC